MPTISMKNMQSSLVLAFSALVSVALLTACASTDQASSDQQQKQQKSEQTAEQTAQQQQQKTSNDQASEEASSEQLEVLYRINAGAQEEYKTEDGETWTPDKLRWKGKKEWGAEGGKAVDRGGIEIRNTDRDPIYRHERWGMAGYSFKVSNGTYKLRLHFAETYHGVETRGDRVFSVAVEGKNVLKNFDVFREAGNSRRTAVVRTIKNVEVSDGELNIVFNYQSLTPIINGIEVIKMP